MNENEYSNLNSLKLELYSIFIFHILCLISLFSKFDVRSNNEISQGSLVLFTRDDNFISYPFV